MNLLAVDRDGFPVLLAEPVVEEPKSEPAPGLHAPPKGIESGEWDRRTDAVRAAAREFETFTAQDAREWLKGTTKRELSDQEVEAFVTDVRSQVVSDMVDILDQGQRGILRGRRTVRVTAPKGYTRKTLASLTDDELAQVKDRLVARGWTDKQVAEKFPGKTAA